MLRGQKCSLSHRICHLPGARSSASIFTSESQFHYLWEKKKIVNEYLIRSLWRSNEIINNKAIVSLQHTGLMCSCEETQEKCLIPPMLIWVIFTAVTPIIIVRSGFSEFKSQIPFNPCCPQYLMELINRSLKCLLICQLFLLFLPPAPFLSLIFLCDVVAVEKPGVFILKSFWQPEFFWIQPHCTWDMFLSHLYFLSFYSEI